MGEKVILHRFEEQERGIRGQRRVLDTGVFDVDDKDNPDWVKEALKKRAEAEPQAEHRLELSDEVDEKPVPAAVFESVEFGEEPSRPGGMDEPEELETAEPDEDSVPAAVFNSIEFGVEKSLPEGAEEEEARGAASDEASEEKPKRASGRRSAAKDDEK
jgi:hypothetical protein